MTAVNLSLSALCVRPPFKLNRLWPLWRHSEWESGSTFITADHYTQKKGLGVRWDEPELYSRSYIHIFCQESFMSWPSFLYIIYIYRDSFSYRIKHGDLDAHTHIRLLDQCELACRKDSVRLCGSHEMCMTVEHHSQILTRVMVIHPQACQCCPGQQQLTRQMDKRVGWSRGTCSPLHPEHRRNTAVWERWACSLDRTSWIFSSLPLEAEKHTHWTFSITPQLPPYYIFTFIYLAMILSKAVFTTMNIARGDQFPFFK